MTREGGRPPRRNAPDERGAGRPRSEGDAQAPSPPPTVKKVRTEHGTRVARSIQCTRCGERDTVHFAPRDAKRVLCRRCAAEVLGVDDPDTNVRAPQPFTCAQCGRQGTTERRVEDPSEFRCGDCFRGIESKQEDKARTAARVSAKVLRVRRKED